MRVEAKSPTVHTPEASKPQAVGSFLRNEVSLNQEQANASEASKGSQIFLVSDGGLFHALDSHWPFLFRRLPLRRPRMLNRMQGMPPR